MMGVDCVFCIKISNEEQARQYTDRLLAAIKTCPGVCHRMEDIKPGLCYYCQEDTFFKTSPLSWKYCCEEDARSNNLSVVSSIADGNPEAYTIEGNNRVRFHHPYFAYFSIVSREEDGFITLHDGCRIHLNKEYQQSVIQWVNNTIDGANCFVVGDCEPLVSPQQ